MTNEIIKVICINNKNLNLKLTLYKTYDAEYIHEQRSYDWGNAPILEWHWYKITDDLGRKEKYNIDRFITLAEWRNRQIDSILND
jgi:hypothetical protein